MKVYHDAERMPDSGFAGMRPPKRGQKHVSQFPGGRPNWPGRPYMPGGVNTTPRPAGPVVGPPRRRPSRDLAMMRRGRVGRSFGPSMA